MTGMQWLIVAATAVDSVAAAVALAGVAGEAWGYGDSCGHYGGSPGDHCR